ncbi:hypothetical protein BpHYR1_018476 [Brachionus plicatilis]|uniref:Uncharacterized protein n=1 Tax=Brachionus plicatilis TaxID=10195 RepID=A0A3M7Q2V3_BRAPC|nr:hypothetical protein BpHYR1_018476 [Brachionus plicatilis]
MCIFRDIIRMSGNDFVCVYFKKDNTFTVYHDLKNKLQKSKSAKFKFENIWITGEIVIRDIVKSDQN